MRRVLLGAVAALFLLTGAVRTYDNSKITIVLSFSAKSYCSCLYVSEIAEADCRKYTDVGPKAPAPRFTVSPSEKAVTASYFYFFRQTARYEGPRFGCRLIP